MSALLFALTFMACGGVDADVREWPAVVPGAPIAGAAEGTLDLPMGTPLGGYSSRCSYLGGTSTQDRRQSQYTLNWDESTGIQTRPVIKVVWLENGDDHLVLIKTDVIYSFDNLVTVVARDLGEKTGIDLDGKVVIATNHSHASYANFSDQMHFYLGGDRYNEEIFRRFASQAVDIAMEAYEGAGPVSLGSSWTRDWDPEDRVYRDRRGENDELQIWEDQGDVTGKDPWLHMLRIDTEAGDPLAAVFTFGVHGTSLGDDNSMVSSDAPGHVEMVFQDQFDTPLVVMHLQGAGGDATPAGTDDGYARLESVGEEAAAALVAAWASTPLSSAPISMETASRHVPQGLDVIEVTRKGAVDWRYRAYEEGYSADDVIYDDAGEILSPIDEFNALYGAGFCGAGSPDDPDVLIPGFDIGSSAYPYNSCVDVEAISAVLMGIFKVDEEEVVLPLRESEAAGTTVSRVGPLLTRTSQGTQEEQDLLIGFFPAETTAMYSEQWRRRVASELGCDMPLLVGYAQDHEGYFLVPEDWLLGGYESNINIWGPLQGEHVMEGMLELADTVLASDVHEDPNPLGQWPVTEYLERELPTEAPDTSPNAGDRLTTLPDYFWLPMGWSRNLEEKLEGHLELEIPAEVPRVQGMVQLSWKGGDPAVDSPTVSLERSEGGSWVAVTTYAGRPINDAHPDILLAWTPSPLYPYEDPQEHLWWAGWQAVGHVHDRAGVPVGTYRMKVTGHHYAGGSESWPWATTAYEVIGESFEVVPAAVSIEVADNGLYASIDAPEMGYRLIDLEGSSVGANPLREGILVSWDLGSEVVEETVSQEVVEGRSFLATIPPDGALSVTVEDGYGNTGTVIF